MGIRWHDDSWQHGKISFDPVTLDSRWVAKLALLFVFPLVIYTAVVNRYDAVEYMHS